MSVDIGRMVSPVLVGREAELERLVAAVSGAPAVAVVEGEAGIGKSRLVAELAARPEMGGRRFLAGGCNPIREPFPLGPLVEALRGEDLTGVSLTPVTGALRPLLPELARVLPEGPERLDDRAAERHRLFRGLADVLAALRPLVLVVEDLHWADEQTVEFLTYLIARLPEGVAVVLTYRGEEVGTDVRAITARPPDGVTAEQLVLVPLDAEQTRVMAATILELDDVSAAFASHLCDRASGLPLAIQELLALLRARGELIRWKGGWARRALDELDVPAGVRDSVRERVGRLPEHARVVAEAAAVLQVAVPVAVLTEVSGLPPADAAAGVDEGLGSALFAEVGGDVGVRHVLAAQAIHEGIPLARRQALHARAADAVRSLSRVPLGQVAHHLRQAGRLGEWVDAAERAAERAIELGDEAEAARLLEDVLRHAALAPERRAALTVRLGWVSQELPHIPDIAGLISQALEHDLPRPVRGELRFLLAMNIDLRRMDPARRYRLAAEAIEDLGDRPELAAWVMIGLSLPNVHGVPHAEHAAWLERAMRLLPTVRDPAERLFVISKVAMVYVAFGDPRWAELTERVMRETDGRARTRREVTAYRSIGEDACFAGHHRRARHLLDIAREGAASCDTTGMAMSRCRASMSVAAYCAGEWAGLREEVEDLRHEHGDRPYELSVTDGIAACLAPAPGALDAAETRLRDVVRRVVVAADVHLLPMPVSMLLRLASALGRAQAGVAETAEAVTAWESKGLWPTGVRALPALVEAWLAAGRPDEAADLVTRYERRLRDLDAPVAGPALGHARGLLAAAEGQYAAAAEAFTAAAAGYRRLPAPYEAAQADEQAAACLFATANGGAEQHVEAALAVYRRLGARWDADRAIRLARAHGLRPTPLRHRDEDGDLVLTARQREVADLAATGMTNQEIARELFLSPKTVDKHLAAALGKLGVSRSDLKRRARRALDR